MLLLILLFVIFFDAGSEAGPFAVVLLAGLVTFMLCLADRLSCVCPGSAESLASAKVVAAAVWAVMSAADLAVLFRLAGLLGWPVLVVLGRLPAEGLP